MFCEECGANIEDGQRFCSNCGHQNGVGDNTSNNDATKKFEEGLNDVKETKKKIDNKLDSLSNGSDNILTMEGETIIATASWSLIALILPFILVGLFLLIYTAGTSSYYGLGAIKVFAWIIYIIVFLVAVWLFLFRRKLVITNKKIYGRMGLIGIKQYTIPLDKVNYLSVRYNIIDRIIGSASFIVSSGASIFPIWFLFVRNAKELRATIEKQMEIYKKEMNV